MLLPNNNYLPIQKSNVLSKLFLFFSVHSDFVYYRKPMPPLNELPTQVPFISATDSRSNSTSDREVIKVVTTAGPQSVDKEFLAQLLSRKDVIPARKRRDFIPNDMKDNHYWERRRKNNLAAKRSREKRRFNDIVLGMTTKKKQFLI
jgi:hypothetical protein